MRVKTGEPSFLDIYRFFRETTKQKIKYKLYKDICSEFNRELMSLVVDKGYRIRLGHCLGYIEVRKTKQSEEKLQYDYGTYRKTGIKTYLFNFHSDGFVGRIAWGKGRSKITFKTAYRFDATREWKRYLASIFKTAKGHTKYIEYKIRRK